ncbi:MAG: DNA repair protein RecO [Acidobacteriota bacterium]|nr:MAG: DNA repair protein RecO [Acidobacteriota bacterium]
MGVVETEGLVVRTYPLGDADKIVVLLTRDDGLVRGVAKGAKRLKSRFGSGLEPFTVVRVSYFRKEERELVTISQIELERSYFSIASDPVFLQHFSYAAELLQSFAPPHDPNERLFNMTRICLETAADDPSVLLPVLMYFETWLLKLGGFLPSWERCAVCGQEPPASEESVLQPDFGITCGRCLGRGRVQTISSTQRSILVKAQKTSPLKFAEHVAGKEADLEEVASILRRMIARILNREVGNSRTAAKP